MRALVLLCFAAASALRAPQKQLPARRQTLTVPLLGSTTHYFGTEANIRAYGYSAEKHKVVTQDGYKLTMYRIPNDTGIPVFFMHGLLSSSTDWVVLRPNMSLAYLLAGAGYDVWMGNARGNTESREVGIYDPDKDAAFWDFSWHEIGAYDTPALIDYVLNYTNRPNLHYVGHSQGTTTFFVMASEVNNIMSKIRTAHLLGPGVFVKDYHADVLKIVSPQINKIWRSARARNDPRYLELLPFRSALPFVVDTFCKARDITQLICYELMFIGVGRDWEKQDRVKMTDYLANLPAGSSLKQAVHFGQLMKAPGYVFRQFDYGKAENVKRYGTPEPPKYDLSRATCNLTMVYGRNDRLATEANVMRIHNEIPDSTVIQVASPTWNHLDFFIRLDVKQMVHDGIIARMRDYDRLHP